MLSSIGHVSALDSPIVTPRGLWISGYPEGPRAIFLLCFYRLQVKSPNFLFSWEYHQNGPDSDYFLFK